MHWCERSGRQECVFHQTAHTVKHTNHTAHTTDSLRMNPQGLKHVADNRN